MFERLLMLATSPTESPWKFSFFSFSSYSAVARERKRQRKSFGGLLRGLLFSGNKEKCRSELERRSVRETAVRERAPRATRVVPPLNEAER